MSLLQDAAEYEERHWSNYLTRIRSQAARDYLSQIGRVVSLVVLSALLLDGARRDIGHASGSVVAVTGSAALQTARGKSAPSFKGQSFGPGDSLSTDITSHVTLAFLDGSVVQLAPNTQLRLTQSDSFRNGQQRRHFQLTSGGVLIYGPAHLETRIATPNGPRALQKGSFAFDIGRGVRRDSASALTRYAVQPGPLARIERAVWWPLDFVLSKLGIMGSGTLVKTDSQRRDACRAACVALQSALKQSLNTLPTGQELPLEQAGLSGETLQQAQSALTGPSFSLSHNGSAFVATVTARDSEATVFTITPTRIDAQRKKN